MKEKIVEKFNQLCKYLYHEERYKNQFLKTIENDLYDFSVILVWKYFMLYLYEKIQQIRFIEDEKVFLEKWKLKFNNEKLKNYPKESLYWPNDVNDDEILAFLVVLYPIDATFITQLRTLKNKRDIAAHVTDEDLTFKNFQINNYLSELIPIVNKVQKYHDEGYLKKIKGTNTFLKINHSFKDTEIFLDELIENLKNAYSFDTAQKYEIDILKFKNYLTEKHIKKILGVIFENPQPYNINQILEASGGQATSNFLKKIYGLNKVSVAEWKKFYQNLKNQKIQNEKILNLYSWLWEIIQEEELKF